MYSEYTTHFTHNIQFVYPVYNLYCIVHTDYTDSQLYVDYIFSLYVQNVCKNNCAVCAMYSVHIAYICAFRNTPFIYLEIVYLPSQDQHTLRALVK